MTTVTRGCTITASRKSLVLLAGFGLSLGLAACSASGGSDAVPPPRGLPDFYRVPAGVTKSSPGTLLKWEPAAAPEVRGSVRRIMYVSTDAKGKPVAVTGLVFAPLAPSPPGGFPVVSWAHGTTGMAPACAPSINPADALPPAIVNGMLALGWEVLATDYQGEGTPPGVLPFLVGDVAARNAIDIVPAARRLPAAAVGNDYVVFGHSEGGQASLFAWSLARTYGARDGIRMVGAVAAAPPSQLQTLYQFLRTTQNRVYDYMMLAGFNVAYGKDGAPLDAVFTQKGIALLPKLRQGCLASVAAAVNDTDLDQLVKANPSEMPRWRDAFAKNDAANFQAASAAPLLIIHGAADEIIPAATSAALTQHLCTIGASVERWMYPGQTHGTVVFAAAVDTARWISDLFRRSPTLYQPPVQEGVQTRACR